MGWQSFGGNTIDADEVAGRYAVDAVEGGFKIQDTNAIYNFRLCSLHLSIIINSQIAKIWSISNCVYWYSPSETSCNLFSHLFSRGMQRVYKIRRFPPPICSVT